MVLLYVILLSCMPLYVPVGHFAQFVGYHIIHMHDCLLCLRQYACMWDVGNEMSEIKLRLDPKSTTLCSDLHTRYILAL